MPVYDWDIHPGGFKTNTDDAPLIRIKYPDEATPLFVEHLFAFFEQVSSNHPRVAYLIDMVGFNPITASPVLRKAFSAEYTKRQVLIESTTVCEALVTKSQILAGLVTAISWLTKRKYPSKIFTEEHEAEAWIREQLKAELL